MAWIDNYLTGVEELDLQHKELFAVTETFRIKMNESNDVVTNEIQNILKFLVDYTLFHFSTEEQFLESISYKGLTAHKQLHKDLIDKLEQIIEKEMTGENTDSNVLYIFLMSWLKKHIAGADQKYKTPKTSYRKFHADRAEDVLSAIHNVLSRVDLMHSNKIISQDEKSKKIIIYLKAFYRSCELEDESQLNTIIDSVRLLRQEHTISSEDSTILKEFIRSISKA